MLFRSEHSQYWPLDLNLLVGTSHYVYGFNDAELRRTGSMRPSQRRKRARLEQRDPTHYNNAQWLTTEIPKTLSSARTSLIVDPPDGRIPYQPWAAARRTELLYDMETPTKLEHIDPEDRCLLPGVPRSNYRGDLQIRQTADYVVILYEWAHADAVAAAAEERERAAQAVVQQQHGSRPDLRASLWRTLRQIKQVLFWGAWGRWATERSAGHLEQALEDLEAAGLAETVQHPAEQPGSRPDRHHVPGGAHLAVGPEAGQEIGRAHV